MIYDIENSGMMALTPHMIEVAQILAAGILRHKKRSRDPQSSALNVSEKGLDVLAKSSVNGDGSVHIMD